MTAALSVAVPVVFAWLGLVVGISFIEAPLKFRAPGVTVRIGLGIGRLVFRVVNTVEAVLAVVLLSTLVLGTIAPVALVPLAIAVGALVVQLLFVRPALARRSDVVLAGGDPPRSRAHFVYIGLEVLKFVALLTGGIAAVAA